MSEAAQTPDISMTWKTKPKWDKEHSTCGIKWKFLLKTQTEQWGKVAKNCNKEYSNIFAYQSGLRREFRYDNGHKL